MNLLDALFPPRCLVCGRVSGWGSPFCVTCRAGVRPIGPDVCRRCGREAAFCVCKGRRFAFRRETAVYYYDEISRGIARFKFRHHPGMAREFARELVKRIEEQYDGVWFDAAAFAPMTPAGERSRGFNQAELLARPIARALGIPVLDVLQKADGGESQHEQTGRAARFRNVRGLYSVKNPGPVKGKRILWVDDVFTTGATADACAKALMEAGAREVFCATIAITRNLRS